MLEIEVVERGEYPRFRVSHDGGEVRALMVSVYPLGSSDPVWLCGPEGMEMIRTLGFNSEVRVATAAELTDMERSSETDLGSFARVVDQVTYGRTPVGFAQCLPENGAAPPLVPGCRYVVFVASPFHMGTAEFTS